MANKIKFGLKAVHYAVCNEAYDPVTGWTTTYGAVKAWTGAVNISLDAQGENTPFYADDGVYAMVGNNQGYSGDFESALIPEDVEIALLNRTLDVTDKVVYETGDDSNTVTYFALMFEFTGDATNKRYVLYRCALTRPTIAGATKGDSIDVQTETVTITATPRLDPDHLVMAHTGDNTDAGVYAGWYSNVYVPDAVVTPAVELSAHAISVATDADITLTAATIPAGATVTWSSSDSSKASVSNGVVTGEAVGNAIITATITIDGVSYSDTCTVVVTND